MPSTPVIILGAGPPFRGDTPPAVVRTSGHRCVLDWIFDAFSSVADAKFHFVGGYRADEVARRYPEIDLTVNSNWAQSGAAESFLTAPLEAGKTHYACYADTVFRKEIVARLVGTPGDLVAGVDLAWKERYRGRTTNDIDAAEKVFLSGTAISGFGTNGQKDSTKAEFMGLVKISPLVVNRILALSEHERLVLCGRPFIDLLQLLISWGIVGNWVNVEGDWAELNAPSDLAHFILGTKAETLDRLQGIVQHGLIGEQVLLSSRQWESARSDCVDRVARKFGDQLVIVRSSSVLEDGWTTANAGRFISVLNVAGSNPDALSAAVDEVIASYEDDDLEHQILIQAMIPETVINGVILTRTLSYGAPYYWVSYDNTGGPPDSVTSGHTERPKTLVVHRTVESLTDDFPSFVSKLLLAVREIETLVGHDSLDLEFVVDGNDNIHILQVRPIAVDHGPWLDADEKIAGLIDAARRLFEDLKKPSPPVEGVRPIFSVMSDWNPGEMIGTHPRPLARSLYEHLITADTWARQRAEYGYFELGRKSLMVQFCGSPYVDIRASFNSFVPASIPDELRRKLVNHYLAQLESQPFLHDKIEFDVVLTCLTLETDDRICKLRAAGFSNYETSLLENALREITLDGMARVSDDRRNIEQLTDRREAVMAAVPPGLNRAFELLEDCREGGILPFAHLARGAFIAMALLKSAVVREILTESDLQQFLNSMHTVAKQFALDVSEYQNARLGKNDLIKRYGHLRAGTYEITYPSYSCDPDRYFPTDTPGPSRETMTPSFNWTNQQRRGLAQALDNIGLPICVEKFEKFVRSTVEGRELAKFEFSKNLSAAIEEIAAFGNAAGVSRETLSFVPLEEFSRLRAETSPSDVAHEIQQCAETHKERYHIEICAELPPLISSTSDFTCFLLHETRPTFVGSLKVIGKVSVLDSKDVDVLLDGRIVLIRQADPGFDWIFSHAVTGLITAFGGTNSHMAIRAAEFGLPAAIGVGADVFDRLIQTHVLCLDCINRRIERLH